MIQADLSKYVENTRDWPPVGRDEWGPTAHHPIPHPEALWTADDRRLQSHGFDPAGLRDELYSPGPFHHDDARPRHRQREAEREAHERAMAYLAVSRTMDRVHNGARVDAGAVGGSN